MGKLTTHGHSAWWPMLLHQRKYADGAMEGRECFVDMRNNTVCEPEDGWNTKDLPYPTGDLVRHASDLYRMNYDKIKWEK